jgi:arylsulfatase A-like enzyme
MLNLARARVPLRFGPVRLNYLAGAAEVGRQDDGQRSVADYINRPREELYDLRRDPDELKNLAQDSTHAGVLKELRGRPRMAGEDKGPVGR